MNLTFNIFSQAIQPTLLALRDFSTASLAATQDAFGLEPARTLPDPSRLWTGSWTNWKVFSVEMLDRGWPWMLGGALVLAGLIKYYRLKAPSPYAPAFPEPPSVDTEKGGAEAPAEVPVPTPIIRRGVSEYEVPGYKIVKKLGEGAMGEVYMAFEEGVGADQPVAIKFLSRAMMNEEVGIERFRREARTMSQVEHRNVVRFYHYGLVEGAVPFIVLEYVDGGTLKDWIQENHPTPHNTRELEKKAAGILIECLSGLEAVHKVGIIHRDLKPANIFMNGGQIPKLGDFGVAKPISPGSTVTAEGIVVGSPPYMAPEQVDIAFDGELDGRVDIHALGVILFKILTWRTPYQGEDSNREEGEDARKVMVRVRKDPVPDPRSINPSISDEMAAILMKALAKDRNQRYQSAEEFAKALETLLASQEPTALLRGEEPQPEAGSHV